MNLVGVMSCVGVMMCVVMTSFGESLTNGYTCVRIYILLPPEMGAPNPLVTTGII